MSDRKKVIVIGGGVVGTACAHYLTKADCEVTIIEKGRHGRGCSHANCGYVSPSHVLPLAGPGVLLTTLKAMMKPNSPFSIKPRLDLALWKWLIQFALRCNQKDALAGGRGIQPLLTSSHQLFQQLVKEDGVDAEWEDKGLLFVYQTKSKLMDFKPTNDLLSEQFNEPADLLDSDQLEELEPALKPGLAGAWYYRHDSHLRSSTLLASWRSLLESKGVKFIEDCDFQAFAAGDQPGSIKTTQGEFAADQFVVATGAWTPLLQRELGCRIPIQPGKGLSITMPKPKICPQIPILFPEHKVGVTPMRSGYRLGSTMEFAGYDATINPNRLALLRKGAEIYLKDPYADPVEEEWFGWRPMTYDSLPIIDRSPRQRNVWIAAGHNMLGLSMATATGKLITELLTGLPPHLDCSHYRVGRFQ